MTALSIELRVVDGQLVSTFINTGAAPLALCFWWNRRLVVHDAQGREVLPGEGAVLPCGVGEDWTLLPPGGRHERNETLACTQPAGRAERIGWAYALDPGTWRVRLVFEAPPKHGFSQSEPHPLAFRGRVESNDVEWLVAPPTQGFFEKLFR